MVKRRSLQWLKLGLIIIAGLFFVLVIISPLLFRALPVQYQAGIARRVPILNAWVMTETPSPTRSYTADTLPTADPSRAAAAMDLLNATATNTPTNTATEIPVSPTSSSTPISVMTATRMPATLVPTNTPRPLPTAIPTHTATPLPATWHSEYVVWVPQGWNNCGPANVAQALGMVGFETTQQDTAAWLKPNPNDANVSTWQMVTYINTKTRMRALQRYNGNLELLKRLLLARFSIIVETGLELPGEEWMGHYVTLIGYDDGKNFFYSLDTYLGTGKDNRGEHEPYDRFDRYWQHFNRVYVVVYPPERENELMAILGQDADPTMNVQRALARALSEAQQVPNNPYAWFNIGTNFVLQRNYASAAKAYDQARNLGLPWRMLWYQFGPLYAYYHTGDYETAMQLVKATFGTTVHVEEIWYWRGMIHVAQGSTNEAIADFNAVLKLNPNFNLAATALASVKAGERPPAPDMI